MKSMKRIICIMLILSLIAFAGCKNSLDNNNNNNNNNNNTENIKSYFPFKENIKYTYDGEGNEYASYTMLMDYITETKVQVRIDNGGTEMVKVFEYKDGNLKEVFSKGEIYYRQNFTDIKDVEGRIILKELLTKNNSWTSNGEKSTITNVDVDISTPMGNYKALEITTEANDYKTINYYTKDIGLIKTINIGKDYEISSTLSKIETDIPLLHNLVLYYPDLEGDVINAINSEISFKTNDDANSVIEKSIKSNQDKAIILSKNTTINNLNLMDDGMVYADFSKELVTEMNAGAYYESMILQCITNIFGNYYGVDKVYITIEGKPYESGHIQMNEKEAFIVNLDNINILE